MKINLIITLVLVTTFELCQGYGYAKQHLTTNSAITSTKDHKFWTVDDVRTPTTPTPAKRRVVRGVFFYTYDDNYNGREIEMHELNPQAFNKLISSNDYAKKPAAVKSTFNFIEFFDGRCEATISCERKPEACTERPCECSTTPIPSTTTPIVSTSTPEPSTTTSTPSTTTSTPSTTTTTPPTTTSPTTTTPPPPTSTKTLTTTPPTTTTDPLTTSTPTKSTTTPSTTTGPPPTSTHFILYTPPTKRGSRVFPSYPTKSYGSIKWPTRKSTYSRIYPTWTTQSRRSFPTPSHGPKIIYERKSYPDGWRFYPVQKWD